MRGEADKYGAVERRDRGREGWSEGEWVKACELEEGWARRDRTRGERGGSGQTSAGLKVGVMWVPEGGSGDGRGGGRDGRSGSSRDVHRAEAERFAEMAVKSHGVVREVAVIRTVEEGGSKTQLFGTGSFKLPGYRPRKPRAGWLRKPHGGSAPAAGGTYAARESRKRGVPYYLPEYVAPKGNAGVHGLMCEAPGQLPADVESIVSETGMVFVKCRPNLGHHPAATGFWFKYQLPGKVEVESARATMDQGMFMLSVLPKAKVPKTVKHATVKVADTPCVHVVNCRMAKKAGCFGGDGAGQQDGRTDTADLGVNKWGDKDKWTGKPLPAYKPLTARQLELSLPRRIHFAKTRGGTGGVALPKWRPATHAEEEWKVHTTRARSA